MANMSGREQSVLVELNEEAIRYNCTDEPTDLYSKANKLVTQEYGAFAEDRPGHKKRIRELFDQLIIRPTLRTGLIDIQAKALQRVLVKLLTCQQARHKSMGMQLLTNFIKLRGATDLAFTGRDLSLIHI